MDSLDFELQIGLRTGESYPVAVRSGEAAPRAATRFPLDRLALDGRLKDLEIALLRSASASGPRRRVLAPQERSVQEFGQILFEALLPDGLVECYAASRRRAAEQGKGLRVRLRIDAPELAALPWEYLYDSQRLEYLSLSRRTALVRSPVVPQPIQQLAVSPLLRVLGLIASPANLPPLDAERERQRVERALGELQGAVEFTWLAGQTWRALWRAMQAGPWHVLHFVGHGGFDAEADEGFIALADEDGQAHWLRASQFAQLVHDHDPLRLVLLNSCEGARGGQLDLFSSTAATLVQCGLPAVLAMQHPISDLAAIEFAHAFYEALGAGLPVDAAVAAARTAVSIAIDGTVEWGTPVLFLRSPDGVLFRLPDGPGGRPPGLAAPAADRAQPARPDTAPTEPAALDELLQDALSQFFARRWDRAVELLTELVARQPGNVRAAARLEQAREQLELAELYERGRAACEAGAWLQALEPLERVLARQADYRDGAALLERASAQQQLHELDAAARRLSERGDWEAVGEVAAEIRALDPSYDPDGLLASLAERLAAARQQARLARLYAEALQQLEAEAWAEAGRRLEAIQAELPDYRETRALLARVEEERALATLYAAGCQAAEAGDWGAASVSFEALASRQTGYADCAEQLERARLQRERSRLPRLVEQRRSALLAETGASAPGGARPAAAPAAPAGQPGRDGAGQQAPPGPVRFQFWRKLPAHQQAVRSVAFSADGSLLATASEEQQVRLYRAADFKRLRTLGGHAKGVFSLAFSPDGALLASGSTDNTVRLWKRT